MRDKVSLRQFLTLVFVGLMSPLVHIMSALTDRIATRGSWAAYLIVMGLFGLWIGVVGWALRNIPGGGMGELLRLGFGERVGRMICAADALFLLVMTGAAMRSYAERFVSTLYPETDPGLFFLVVLLFALWFSERSFAALARTGQIFLPGILVVVGLVLAANVGQMRLYYVLPIRKEDVSSILRAGLVSAGVLSIGFAGLFCFSEVEPQRKGIARSIRWTGLLCALALILNAVTTGVFSSALTPSFQVPFFMLAKEVRIAGALERMESFVAAVWLFTDVVLISLLLRCARRAAEQWVEEEGEMLCGGMVLFLLPFGYLIAESSFQLEQLYQRGILWGEGVLFGVIPVCSVLLGWARKKM